MGLGYNMIMLVLSFVTWWYGAGWHQRAKLVAARIDRTLDYFSISLLLKTLFTPFRQISAGKVNGSLDTKFRAFIDRLISRLIGAMIRSTVLLVGLVSISLQALLGLVILIGWAAVPLLPFVGMGLYMIGWLPS